MQLCRYTKDMNSYKFNLPVNLTKLYTVQSLFKLSIFMTGQVSGVFSCKWPTMNKHYKTGQTKYIHWEKHKQGFQKINDFTMIGSLSCLNRFFQQKSLFNIIKTSIEICAKNGPIHVFFVFYSLRHFYIGYKRCIILVN